MKAENAEICRRLRSQLGKLHDITRIVMRIKKVGAGSRPRTSALKRQSEETKWREQAFRLRAARIAPPPAREES